MFWEVTQGLLGVVTMGTPRIEKIFATAERSEFLQIDPGKQVQLFEFPAGNRTFHSKYAALDCGAARMNAAGTKLTCADTEGAIVSFDTRASVPVVLRLTQPKEGIESQKRDQEGWKRCLSATRTCRPRTRSRSARSVPMSRTCILESGVKLRFQDS